MGCKGFAVFALNDSGLVSISTRMFSRPFICETLKEY